MLIALFAPQAMEDMRLLQVAYPNEVVGNFSNGEFLCRNSDGALTKELDESIPTRLSFLDHLGDGALGTGEDLITIEQFADVLVSQLQRVGRLHGRDSVDGIKDIDLLGCEGGVRWVDKQGVLHETAAEVIARKLTEAGYSHITVHTFTPQFIGDNTVTKTRLSGGGPPGQPFDFYGSTDDGIRAIDDARTEWFRAEEAYKQARHQHNVVAARVEQINAGRSAPVAPGLQRAFSEMNRRDADVRAAQVKLDSILLQYRKPKEGTLQGMDLRQALADRRNVVNPIPPLQFTIEQLKSLSETLKIEGMHIDVLDEPPVRMRASNPALSYFKKYLDGCGIPYSHPNSDVIEFPDSFSGSPELYAMIQTFYSPLQRSAMMREREDPIPLMEEAYCRSDFIAMHRLLSYCDELEIQNFFRVHDINKADENGLSVVHLTAASDNDIELFKRLLSVPTLNINACSKAGTAKEVAEFYGAQKIVDYFDVKKTEVLQAAGALNRGEISILYQIVSQWNDAEIQRFFKSNDVNKVDANGFNLLHITAGCGDVALFKRLLSVPNIDIDACSRQGTAKEVAQIYESHEVIDFINEKENEARMALGSNELSNVYHALKDGGISIQDFYKSNEISQDGCVTLLRYGAMQSDLNFVNQLLLVSKIKIEKESTLDRVQERAKSEEELKEEPPPSLS